jgi:Domain of unknown function (DUF1707)
MNDQRDMRASDHDRQEVVNLLRAALEDGRLTMDEYVDRMALAYQAVTYGDLAPLHGDLPATSPRARHQPPGPPAQAAPVTLARRSALAGLPPALRVLWTIWLTVVLVNVVVWALVSVTTAHLIYPWPLWVAGPWGAVLLAVSVGAVSCSGARAGARSALSR